MNSQFIFSITRPIRSK